MITLIKNTATRKEVWIIIVTGKCIELTIAITGGATILRMGYKTVSEASRNFFS